VVIYRDAAEGNKEKGEEVHDPSVMKESTHVIRCSVSFDIPDDESGDSGSSSDEDEAGDGVVWPTFKVQVAAY